MLVAGTRYLEFEISSNLDDDAVKRVHDAIPEKPDHAMQAAQHAAVFGVERVYHVTANGRRGGEVIRVVCMRFALDFRERHIKVFDLLGRVQLPRGVGSKNTIRC